MRGSRRRPADPARSGGQVVSGIPRLLLLDLDETLLPTSALRDIRHSGECADLADVSIYLELRLHAGVISTLELLATQLRLGVVSSSPRWYVEQILADHLPGLSFDPIVTFDDVTELKPDPEPLQKAVELSGIPVTDIWYVGDALLDHEACRRMGMPFLAAGWAGTEDFPRGTRVLARPSDLAEACGLSG
jgi:phosphoglycolate phosphatase-like HAD superfamily hydrolase